jgi:hypothetical protein
VLIDSSSGSVTIWFVLSYITYLLCLFFYYFIFTNIQTPHYSISRNDWIKFEKTIAIHDYNIYNKKIIYYKNDTSYQDHPFCTVINYLDDNDILFEDIDFSLVQSTLEGVKMDDNRGNFQTNYGYATLNITEIDEESSIRRPNLVYNTIMQSNNFIAISHLLKYNHPATANTFKQQPQRLEKFAKKIHPANVLEGLTYAKTYIKNKQSTKTQLFNCHVDSNNSQQQGWDYCIIASTIKVIKGTIQRFSVIGYSKKSIDDYFMREKIYLPALITIQTFMDKLSPQQKDYNAKTLNNPNCNSIIDNKIVVRDANINIKCYLSSFVFILDKAIMH